MSRASNKFRTSIPLKVRQKIAARRSRNHKQGDQSQPNGISCTQRMRRNAEKRIQIRSSALLSDLRAKNPRGIVRRLMSAVQRSRRRNFTDRKAPPFNPLDSKRGFWIFASSVFLHVLSAKPRESLDGFQNAGQTLCTGEQFS